MGTIEYHKAKELIEKGIGEHIKQFDSVELPAINIERKGKDTSIEFAISKDVNLYTVVNAIVTTLGPMEISEFIGDLSLKHDGTHIYISTRSVVMWSGYPKVMI